MSNYQFCAEGHGDLKSTDNGYKCLTCDKKYSQAKNNDKKEKQAIEIYENFFKVLR